MPKNRLISKEKISKQPVTMRSVKEFLTSDVKDIFKKYYVGEILPKTIKTQGQLDELAKMFKKFSELDDALKETGFKKFSTWESFIIVTECNDNAFENFIKCIRNKGLDGSIDSFKIIIAEIIKEKGLDYFPKEKIEIPVLSREVKKAKPNQDLPQKSRSENTEAKLEVTAPLEVDHDRIEKEIKYINSHFNSEEIKEILKGLQATIENEESLTM